MTNGVDYPWSKPAPAALKAAGITFAMRYLSNDETKNLTRSEADALAAQGIWSGVVWETTAGRALAGRAAGVEDAREALAQARACGMPNGRPIYVAVDFDVTSGQQAAVDAYIDGASSVLGPDGAGVYGGHATVKRALDRGAVRWGWQTFAWSQRVVNGKRITDWDPRAQIRQTGTVRIGGVECDTNEATAADFGQWMPGRTPDIEEDDNMATVTQERSDSWNSMIWGLKHTSEQTLALVQAQGATIAQLAAAVATVHGIDQDQLIEQIKTAIADAVVKVDVSVGQKGA